MSAIITLDAKFFFYGDDDPKSGLRCSMGAEANFPHRVIRYAPQPRFNARAR